MAADLRALVLRLRQPEPNPESLAPGHDLIQAEIDFLDRCRLERRQGGRSRQQVFQDAYAAEVREQELYAAALAQQRYGTRFRSREIDAVTWLIEYDFYEFLACVESDWAGQMSLPERARSFFSLGRALRRRWQGELRRVVDGRRRSLRRLLEEVADQWCREMYLR